MPFLRNPSPGDVKVCCPTGKETFDDESTKKHRPKEVVAKLRDADAIPNAGKDLAAVLRALEVSESTLERWRDQYGGMKCEQAKRLRHSEDENRRLKQLVADQALDIQMLKDLSEGNWQALPERSSSS